MAVIIRGNHAPANPHSPPGTKLPAGHLTITGAAADVAIVGLEDLAYSQNSLKIGVSAQAPGTTATIQASLVPMAEILQGDSANYWSSPINISSAVEDIPVAASYKVTFSSDGTVYLLGV